MLIVKGKTKRLSPTLTSVYAEATLRLQAVLQHDSSTNLGVQPFDRLTARERWGTLLVVAYELLSPSDPTQSPSIWADASVVATFNFVGQVVEDRISGHVDCRAEWRRTIGINYRNTRVLSEKVLMLRNRYLNVPWEPWNVTRGRRRNDDASWKPARVRDAVLPIAFWDATPLSTDEAELHRLFAGIHEMAARHSVNVSNREQVLTPPCARMTRRVCI